jgi:acyl-CoA synthetase (AMP-forming)/AMP-acid ligase II
MGETMNAGSALSEVQLPGLATATVPALWRATVGVYGDLTMIRKDGESLSYRDVDQRAAALACGLLADGAGKGSRIGVLMPNGPEWIIAWLAINRIGGIAICLSSFFTARELAYAVPHADISILLCAERYLRNDYVARLEEAFPALSQSDGAAPLALVQAPYLRSVWFTGQASPRWSRGSVRELEARGAQSTVFDAALLAAIEDNVSPADLAVLIYTSGSTAHPKGVVHSQGTTVRKTLFMTRGKGIIPYETGRGDRQIITMPLFWVGGLLSMTGCLVRGAAMIFLDDHSPNALLEAVRREDATHLSGSEAVLLSLRDSAGYRPGDLDRLKPQNTNQLPFFNHDPDITRNRFAFSLGMTETFGPHSGNTTGELLPPEVSASVGPALEGVTYKIVDPQTGALSPPGVAGELCVRGGWLMQGMYKKEREEVFDADGYYHTGDQCILRPDGYLVFDCRISGMIKTSGANVSPEEVEGAIRGLADVAEVAVLGLPDRTLGQMVVAAVVRRAGSLLDEQTVKAHVRGELSSFKAPKRVFFFEFDDLPRTPSNKIRKPPLTETIVQIMKAEDA